MADRVCLAFFVGVGNRPKGKVVAEVVIDLNELRKESNLAFILGCSESFTKNKLVDPTKVSCYIPWKGKPVRVTDFNIVRDGEDLYVCSEDHVKALHNYILGEGDGMDASQAEIATNLKRKRDNLGENTKERLETHNLLRNDKAYNNSARRLEEIIVRQQCDVNLIFIIIIFVIIILWSTYYYYFSTSLIIIVQTNFQSSGTRHGDERVCIATTWARGC
tara:strand:- start:759 stop:1415 length:657 start_codon:yes stop_codon:yes gene_type:complete